MPLPVDGGTSAESVCLDWKLTNFSMVCWIRCGETFLMAAAICGSGWAAGIPATGVAACPNKGEAVNHKIDTAKNNSFILNMKPRKTSVHLMGLLLDADRKRF